MFACSRVYLTWQADTISAFGWRWSLDCCTDYHSAFSGAAPPPSLEQYITWLQSICQACYRLFRNVLLQENWFVSQIAFVNSGACVSVAGLKWKYSRGFIGPITERFFDHRKFTNSQRLPQGLVTWLSLDCNTAIYSGWHTIKSVHGYIVDLFRIAILYIFCSILNERWWENEDNCK